MSATTAVQPTPAHQLSGSSANQSAPETASKFQSQPDIRGIVDAQLNFFSPPEDGAKPYAWAGDYQNNPPNGIYRNYGVNERTIEVNDLRGHESDFTLDGNAFAALRDVPSLMEYEDWESEEKIRQVYYPEIEELLKRHVPGVHKVFLFDHTIRRPNSTRMPVQRVHIDQTPKSTEMRVRHHLPDEADQLLQGRYRIINIWRPLNGAVVSHPLAVADSATVSDEDLIPVEHRYPDRTGETASVKFNEKQKWYYWSQMGDEERLLLKCFDSDEIFGRTGRVPHTAFDDPRTPESAKGRESIEVRALVFG